MRKAALLLGAAIVVMLALTCRRRQEPLPVPKMVVGAMAHSSSAALPPRRSPKPSKPRPPGYDLVRPAPSGFKPESSAAKIKLTLIPESEFIHRGTSFWYRLELQNVGSQPLQWEEAQSFFEDGYLFNGEFQFFLTQPDSKKVRMLPPTDREEPEGTIASLSIQLKAGETLVTRPWSYLGLPQMSWGPFRELASRYHFGMLGTYKIAATLKARGAIAPVESNSVTFEVVP